MALPTLGIQLGMYGSRYDMDKDLDLVLNSVQASGYAAVEGGIPTAEFIEKVQARGLIIGGAHVTMPALEDLDTAITALHAGGCQDLCNSGLLKWGGLTAQDYREAIPVLNAAGKALRAEGIFLHYHHHEFEFRDLLEGGQTGIEMLLDGLDPDAVDLCVDIAWVYKGGTDPAAFLTEHKDRIGYLHFKDCASDSRNTNDWTELGRGTVDFPTIIPVLADMPLVRWVMVEQDSTQIDPVESAEISRRYLQDRFGF